MTKVKKPWWKRLLKFFAWLTLIPIVLLVVVIALVFYNQDSLVQKGLATVNESFAGQIKLKDSHISPFHDFPIVDPDSLPDDAVRAGAHEDINLITLLIGASADGLEVLTREGTWYAVKPNAEDIVVNVGDMLQRLTNNKLKSTTHRVVNPPRELMKNSRFSVPFFLHPKGDMDLTTLESCIDQNHPKSYTTITAGEYLDERLREIGLKM